MVEIINYLKENYVESKPRYFTIAPFNIGAILLEAILQSGLNYNNVVKPRIERYYDKYESFYSLSHLNFLLQYVPLEDIMGLKNNRKKETLLNLIQLLAEQNIEYTYQLQDKMMCPKFIEVLMDVKGIGSKTVDYLMILLGLDSIAIDRHLFNFLNDFGIDLKYNESKEIFKKVAEELEISMVSLDAYIWNKMSKRTSNKRKKR